MKPSRSLARKMGLLTLTATGICSMLGASVYLVPFMIHRSVPGIGPYVLPAFAFAAVPALLAAFSYAILGSAMPRAGGSYIYASRGLHPYLGFVASFSQWFGLSIVIGVIAYVTVPFVRDVTINLGWTKASEILETGWVRVSLALLLIWTFVGINLRGTRSYQRALIPMMFIMFALGTIVIVAGFYFDATDFQSALQDSGELFKPATTKSEFSWQIFLSAAALLFSSFIGFDSIAQAGGEAKNPRKLLPRAILLAIVVVGCFYFLFTAAVYHTVPWNYVAEKAMAQDITAPGLLSYVLPTGLGVLILTGAAIALINDLPAMLLSVSRLMFAWAKDGIFPKQIARIHPTRQTPTVALILAGAMASIGALGSHFAGDFFLGIDIMVTSMMVNFLLMCVTLIRFPERNQTLYQDISVCKGRGTQLIIGWLGIFFLVLFLIVHTYKDLTADVAAWYFHSTWIWLIVIAFGSFIYFIQWKDLNRKGIDTKLRFGKLPED